MRIGSMRVDERSWYANEGFRDAACWRRHNGHGWMYFIRIW
jgi:hypothetical protein